LRENNQLNFTKVFFSFIIRIQHGVVFANQGVYHCFVLVSKDNPMVHPDYKKVNFC
jgi:hypothetical protein